MEIILKGNFDIIQSPAKMHGTIDMSVKEGSSEDADNASTSMEMYLIQNDDAVTSYVNYDGSGWYSSDSGDIYSSAVGMAENATSILDEDYIEKLNMECTGSKRVNGVNCYIVTGNINGDTLVDLLKESKDEYSYILEDEESMTFIKELSIPFTYYIDQETYYLIRSEIDLSKVIDSFADLNEVDIELTSKDFSIDYSNYNDVKDITVPHDVIKEAKGNTSEVNNDVKNQTHVWEDCKFTYRDHTYVLNTSVLQDLLDNGVKIAYEDESNMKVDADEFENYYLYSGENEDKNIGIQVENDTGESANAKDLKITYIYCHSEEEAFTLSGGITIGSTRDEVKKAYGDPNAIEDGDYSYTSKDDKFTLYIGFVDDKVSGIYLDSY